MSIINGNFNFYCFLGWFPYPDTEISRGFIVDVFLTVLLGIISRYLFELSVNVFNIFIIIAIKSISAIYGWVNFRDFLTSALYISCWGYGKAFFDHCHWRSTKNNYTTQPWTKNTSVRTRKLCILVTGFLGFPSLYFLEQ